MFILDPRSIILVTVLTAFLFFLVLLGLHRSMQGELPGLRESILCAFAWFLGIGAIFLRGVLPDTISIIGGNTAVSIGIVALYAALKLSAGQTVNLRRWLLITTLFSAVVESGLAAYGNYRYLLVFTCGYNGAMLLLCAKASLQIPVHTFATRVVTISALIAACVSIARSVVSAIGLDIVASAFDPAMFQKFYFSLIGFSIMSLLIGITLMTYDRLRKVLDDANMSLEFQVARRTRELTLEIVKKENLERSIATTADAERRRIGHELHDDLGQRMTGISLVAESLSRRLANVDARMAEDAATIERAASKAISQMRCLAHGLIPVGPEPEGLQEALAELARSTSASGIRCTFEHDDLSDITNQDVSTNLFRIAQEAIANTMRHARATALTIRLHNSEGKVNLTITDNGAGFASCSSASHGSGRGLGIMEFRAGLIDYRLDVASAPGRGCVVRAVQC